MRGKLPASRFRPVSNFGGFGYRHRQRPTRMRDPLAALGPYLEDLNARADEELLNSPIAVAVLRNYVDGTVGKGLQVSPEIDAGELGVSDQVAEQFVADHNRWWRRWTTSKPSLCDFYGKYDFADLCRLTVYGSRAHGDIAALYPDAPAGDLQTRVQLIRADRIADPVKNPYKHLHVVDGVALDEHGREAGLWIRSRTPKGKESDAYYRPVVGGRLHYTRITRGARSPEDVRGVSILVSIVESIRKMVDFMEAEVTAAFVQACFAGFVTSDGQPGSRGRINDNRGEGDKPLKRREEDIRPGTLQWLSHGEKVNFAAPSRPSQGVMDFLKANMAMIAMATGIPADVLMDMFEKSYSSSRTTIKRSENHLTIERGKLANDFIFPVRGLVIDECVAKGYIHAPGYFEDPLVRDAWLNANIQGPAALHVDPVKEITAAKMRLEAGLTTHQKEAAMLGNDWRDQFGVLKSELAMLEELRHKAKSLGDELEALQRRAILEDVIDAA